MGMALLCERLRLSVQYSEQARKCKIRRERNAQYVGTFSCTIYLL